MKRMCIILFLCFLPIVSSSQEAVRDFAPWNSGVNTGDLVFTGQDKNSAQGSSVTNGFQGGAWMLIKMFQVFISPQDGPNCRHRPTCSAYGREAVVKHGALAGSFMAGERLLRCNPFRHPEYDPVPDRIFGE